MNRPLFFASVRQMLQRLPSLALRAPLWLRLICWYLFACGLLYSVQADLIYHPSRYPLAVLEQKLKELAPVSARLVEDGLALELQGSATAGATAIFFHGNAGSALARASLYAEFSRRGYDLVLAEYPGYGWRGGEPSQIQIVKEGLRLYASVLREEPGRPVVLVGESLGSGVAVQVAALAPVAPAKLVLITPYTSFTDVASSQFWAFPVKALLRDKFESAKALVGYKGPVALLVAEKDEVLGARTGLNLASVSDARGPTKLITLPLAAHNTWRQELAPLQWDELLSLDAAQGPSER